MGPGRQGIAEKVEDLLQVLLECVDDGIRAGVKGVGGNNSTIMFIEMVNELNNLNKKTKR